MPDVWHCTLPEFFSFFLCIQVLNWFVNFCTIHCTLGFVTWVCFCFFYECLIDLWTCTQFIDGSPVFVFLLQVCHLWHLYKLVEVTISAFTCMYINHFRFLQSLCSEPCSCRCLTLIVFFIVTLQSATNERHSLRCDIYLVCGLLMHCINLVTWEHRDCSRC